MAAPETGTPQVRRYRTAQRAWEAAQHRPLDRHQRSLLYLVTSDAGLWAWTRPRLDAAQGRVDLRGGAELNAAQRLLLDVARALYGEEHAVNVAAVADALDADQFATVLTALQAYRQDVEPLQVAAALPAQAGREDGAAAPAPREADRPPPDDAP